MLFINRQRVENYVTITKRQSDGFISYHPELPTVISQGETIAEAEANLVEATALAIAHLEATGSVAPPAKNFQDVVFDMSYP